MPKILVTKRPARPWRDPATLADRTEKLEIVRALNDVKLQEHWQRPAPYCSSSARWNAR